MRFGNLQYNIDRGFKVRCEGVEWFYVTQDRIQW
jgi:hypothetical protein